jgi:hypothetical protein
MAAAADLRAFADLLDRHPQLADAFNGSDTFVGCDHRHPFPDLVRQLATAGRVEKGSDDGRFEVTLQIGTVKLILIDTRGDVVCEKVQTGTRTVEKPILQQVGVETAEEPVYEWRCPPSILAASGS